MLLEYDSVAGDKETMAGGSFFGGFKIGTNGTLADDFDPSQGGAGLAPLVRADAKFQG